MNNKRHSITQEIARVLEFCDRNLDKEQLYTLPYPGAQKVEKIPPKPIRGPSGSLKPPVLST
jgi:hypothetical protein